ncbi:hypothetical protein PYCC9005_003252 [Savitreella phatthalungensis]
MGRLNVQFCEANGVELGTGGAVPFPLQAISCHFSISAMLGPILLDPTMHTCELRISLAQANPDGSQTDDGGVCVQHGQVLDADSHLIGSPLDIGTIDINSRLVDRHTPELICDRRSYRGPERKQVLRYSQPTRASEALTQGSHEVCLFQDRGRRLTAIIGYDSFILRSEPVPPSSSAEQDRLNPVNQPFHDDASSSSWLAQLIGITLPPSTMVKPFVVVRVSVSSSMCPDTCICLETSKLKKASEHFPDITGSYQDFAAQMVKVGFTGNWVDQYDDVLVFLASKAIDELPPPYSERIGRSSELCRSDRRSTPKAKSQEFFYFGQPVRSNEIFRGAVRRKPYDDRLWSWSDIHPAGPHLVVANVEGTSDISRVATDFT